MRHPLPFAVRCLILLAVLLAIPRIAQAQQAAPFQAQTQTYPFSASTSAGTAVQIAANSGGPTGYGQYLVVNTGANGAWVTLAFSSSGAAQTIPSGSTPGNAVWLPAGAACTYTAPSQAWFNAQTASSTTTLTVTGGTGSNGCVAQSGGGSGPTGTVTANQGTANTLANGWPTKITDGTNVLGTVSNPFDVTVPPGIPLAANVAQINGVTVLTGAGAASTSERFTAAQDVTTAAGIGPTQAASGNITTQNLNPNSGTATAGSVVAITLYNSGTCTIQVTGTYTASGGLSPQVTTDGANWVTQTSASTLQNMNTGAMVAAIPSGATGIWQIEINGHNQFRIGANSGAVTGTAVTTIQCAPGTSQTSTSINSPLPAGTNTIGAVIVGSPPTASILVGRQSFTANGGPTTLITITAGKTFTGTIGASVSCDTVAGTATACQATAAFTTVGAGTTPAAGAIFDCDARSGANAATGTVGSQSANWCSIPINVNCASGTCTVAVAATIAGTAGVVTATASGTQQ